MGAAPMSSFSSVVVPLTVVVSAPAMMMTTPMTTGM